MVPATLQPASSSTSGIPFATSATSASTGSATGLLVAGVLLAVAFVVLYVLRRRGYGVSGASVADRVPASGLAVVQRLRLGAACTGIVLRDGNTRLLVVESRHGVQVTRLDPTEPTA